MQDPGPVISQATCQYGLYDFNRDDGWKPLVNGRFPQLSPRESYAVKVTLTDTSTNQDLHPADAPGITFSHTPWSTLSDNPWHGYTPGSGPTGLILPPEGSVVAYEPLSEARLAPMPGS